MVVRTRKILLSLLLLFLLSTGVFVFLHSPGFYLSSFEVRGNDRLTEKEVIDLSGLLYGEHLMVAFDSAIRNAIVADPWIRDVTVRMAYPGRIIITVQERRPAAILTSPAGAFYLIDERGFLLDQQPSPDGDLIIVTGMNENDTAAAGQAPSARLTTALRVVRMAETVNLPLPVQEVSTGPAGEVDLFLAGGVRAVLGLVGADLAHLFQVLAGVLESLGEEARAVNYVDLRFERPVVQKRGE